MSYVTSESFERTIINGRIIDTSDLRLILRGATEKTEKRSLVILAARWDQIG